MKNEIYYKYELNNVIYVSKELPENANILERMNILNANEGYELRKISNNEIIVSSIWLKNGDSQDNYEEIELKNDSE